MAQKSCIAQSNQENTYLLIIRLVRVKAHSSANTARHYCKVKDRQETCSRLMTRIHIMNWSIWVEYFQNSWYLMFYQLLKLIKSVVVFTIMASIRLLLAVCLSCTLRSWLHEISAPIMTLSPGLEKNYTLERSSKSFPGMTSMSGCLENCQKYIPKSQCSTIQETRS